MDIECRYRERNYCIYSNRNCNPRNISCVKYHKLTYAPVVPIDNGNAGNNSVKKSSDSLIPTTYDKTITCNNTMIFVFGGALNIKKKYLSDVRLIVQDVIDQNKTYALYVIFNRKTKRYYMGEQVLNYYIKKNYHPNVLFKYASSGECTEPFTTHSMDNLSAMSVLKMYGYTVGKTSGLSDEQRHILLEFIIENKLMKCFEIVNLLQFNIAMRERELRYQKAVRDWKNDIYFVTHYIS